jgi:hypothetical protein
MRQKNVSAGEILQRRDKTVRSITVFYRRECAHSTRAGRLSNKACRQIVTLTANYGQDAGTKYVSVFGIEGFPTLAYQVVAARENETVTYQRMSVLIAIAKARVWTSEGWQVVITDEAGKTLEPAELEKLLAA